MKKGTKIILFVIIILIIGGLLAYGKISKRDHKANTQQDNLTINNESLNEIENADMDKDINTTISDVENNDNVENIKFNNSKMKIKYGSQWVSITDDLVQYILKNRKVIYKLFKFSNCADELFIQTLIYNSKYRYRLYDEKFDNSIDANKRLIDWSRGRNGNPYVWTILDKKVIDESECLFARKFDEIIDEEIIKYIISKVK